MVASGNPPVGSLETLAHLIAERLYHDAREKLRLGTEARLREPMIAAYRAQLVGKPFRPELVVSAEWRDRLQGVGIFLPLDQLGCDLLARVPDELVPYIVCDDETVRRSTVLIEDLKTLSAAMDKMVVVWSSADVRAMLEEKSTEIVAAVAETFRWLGLEPGRLPGP